MKKLGLLIIPYIVVLILLVICPFVTMGSHAFMNPQGHFTLANIRAIGSREVWMTFIYSFAVSIRVTVICLLLAYPAAYFMTRRRFRMPSRLYLLFLLPLGVNMLLYTFSTVAVLDLLKISYGYVAMYIGLVCDFLPFMIIPLHNCLMKVDENYEEASADLGAGKIRTFVKVVLPLSVPGIISGVSMVFLPALSTFAVTELLTMNKIKLFGSIIESTFSSGSLEYGSAMAMIMLVLIFLTQIFQKEQ